MKNVSEAISSGCNGTNSSTKRSFGEIGDGQGTQQNFKSRMHLGRNQTVSQTMGQSARAQGGNTEVALGQVCGENCFEKISPLLIWLCIIGVGVNPGGVLSLRLPCACPPVWAIPVGPTDTLEDGGYKRGKVSIDLWRQTAPPSLEQVAPVTLRSTVRKDEMLLFVRNTLRI